jgi:hypothetical protein
MICSQSQREPKYNFYCCTDRFLTSTDIENILRPWQVLFQISASIKISSCRQQNQTIAVRYGRKTWLWRFLTKPSMPVLTNKENVCPGV